MQSQHNSVRRFAFVLECSAAALLGVAPLAAQAPQEPPREVAPSAAVDARERPAERLLHMADGTILRARARWNGSSWELEERDGWRALPAGSVNEARLEREVLAQSRDLARSVTRGDRAQRVALADWMLRAGLAQEALAELDAVLTADPDEKSALALLAHPPQPLRIAQMATDDPEELMRRACAAPPAVRELALRRLAELQAPEDLRASLAAALQSHSPRMRSFAALGLRRLHPGTEIRQLAVRSVLDGSQEVRHEACLALKTVEDAAVILPAVRALGSTNASVRANAAEALGSMGYSAAVPALIGHLSTLQSGSIVRPPRSNIFVGRQFAYVQDYDVEVAQFSAIADPIVNTLVEGSVLDVRVIGVNVVTTAVESSRVRRSLALLTGEERSSRGWLAWWNEQQDADDSVPTSPTTTGG
jgi:hypothetical protein